MKRERGFFFAPWLIYLAIAGAALGALWLAYSTVDGRGYARGQAEAVAVYAKRDNHALQTALTRVAALEADRRAKESAHEAELQKIRDRMKKEKADAQRQRDADLAAARDGTLKLRDPGTAASTAQCDRGQGAAPGAAAGGGDGAKGGELSAAASEFLLQLVHDADRNTRQLTDAQAVIEAQIRACNGP